MLICARRINRERDSSVFAVLFCGGELLQKVRNRCTDTYLLHARRVTRFDFHCTARDQQCLSEDAHQLVVRRSIDRRRRHADSEGTVMLARNLAARRARHDPDFKGNDASFFVVLQQMISFVFRERAGASPPS